MTPERFSITGSIGIRAGLGRETLSIDLGQIPLDARTVAIRGDNGSGKSTILNLALTPWREPRIVPGSIYDHFSESGERYLRWSHDGETYESNIQYKQTPRTKAQRAVLLRVVGDTLTSVRLPDGTVSDGKTSTYDACLEHILGYQDIYYMSAFRAQNAPTIAEYADPKALMRALLCLNEPASMAALAADVARGLKRHHADLQGSAEQLSALTVACDELRDMINEIDDGAISRAGTSAAAQNAVARARTALGRAADADLDRQRIVDLREGIIHRELALKQKAMEDSRSHGRAVRHAQQAVSDARESHIRRLNGIFAEGVKVKLREADAIKLISSRPEIEAAILGIKEVLTKIESADADMTGIRADLSALRSFSADLQSAIGEGDALAGRIESLTAQIIDLTGRAGFVDSVPCHGQPPYNECPALADAMMAKGRADSTQKVLGVCRGKQQILGQAASQLRTKIEKLNDPESREKTTANLLRRLRGNLDRLNIVASRKGAIDAATSALAESQADLAGISARRDAETAMSERHMAKLNEAVSEAEAEAARAKRAIEVESADVRAELEAAPMPGSPEAMRKAETDLANADTDAQQAQDIIFAASEAKASHMAEIARLEAEILRGKETSARADHLAIEIADWTLLALALRGVIDLSIEDAGPSIAAIANRLLSEAYGPRFTVRIVTQRAQANGRLVETFDISVIDAETGVECSLMHKSGGETVWLDKALTDAIGIYHRDSSGVEYETLFADEADDGLTAERKDQFYRMDLAALDLGGYRRKYFVSHHAEAWAMADYVIDIDLYKVAA